MTESSDRPRSWWTRARRWCTRWLFPHSRKEFLAEIRGQLSELSTKDPDQLSNADRECIERCVCAAGKRAFDERYRHALGKGFGRLFGFFAGFGLMVAFALGAASRWKMTSGMAVWILLAEVLFLTVVFPGGILFTRMLAWLRQRAEAGLSLPIEIAPTWTPQARLYMRTLICFVLGVASIVAVLTLSVRHFHISNASKVVISGFLGGLPVVLALLVAVALETGRSMIVRPQDPYPKLVLALLRTLAQLQIELSNHHNGWVLPASTRKNIAAELESAVRAMAAHASLNPPVAGELGAKTVEAVNDKGAKVAAWLRLRQVEILWPSPAAVMTSVQEDLAAGLLDTARGDWKKLQAPVPASNAPKTTWLVKMLPRFGLTMVLLAAAFVIPKFIHLSSGAAATLTITLIVTAFTALTAPSDVLSKVADEVSSAGGSGS